MGMTTNATLVTEEKARSLSKSGLDTVAVSLDGIGETHNTFRKVNNSFEKAIDPLQHNKAFLSMYILHKLFSNLSLNWLFPEL